MQASFKHGYVWLGWVCIVFGIGLVVLLFGFFDNFVTVLEAFGYQVNDITKHGLFWAMVSGWFLLSLRGARLELKMRGD